MELLLPEVRRIDGDDLLDLFDLATPYVRAGMLVSLDGATSRDGRSAPLQTPGDGQVFRALRSVADAVIVGAGTARAESYGPVRLSEPARRWRRTRGRRGDVPLVVVSRSLELPLQADWLQRARPLVVTCARAPEGRRRALAGSADVLVCGDDEVDLSAAGAALGERGLSALLCEGGPRLVGDLARAGLLTEVCATVAPLLAGAADGMLRGALPAALPLVLVHLLREESTLLGRWVVRS